MGDRQEEGETQAGDSLNSGRKARCLPCDAWGGKDARVLRDRVRQTQWPWRNSQMLDMVFLNVLVAGGQQCVCCGLCRGLDEKLFAAAVPRASVWSPTSLKEGTSCLVSGVEHDLFYFVHGFFPSLVLGTPILSGLCSGFRISKASCIPGLCPSSGVHYSD